MVLVGLICEPFLKNWKFFRVVSYDQQFNIFSQTKFVLNLDPNWTYGVHDRVFNALGSGAAVMTNENHYSNVLFHEGIDSILLSDTSQVPEKLLFGLGYWSQIPANGRKFF